jgi:hypothetical protein
MSTFAILLVFPGQFVWMHEGHLNICNTLFLLADIELQSGEIDYAGVPTFLKRDHLQYLKPINPKP